MKSGVFLFLLFVILVSRVSAQQKYSSKNSKAIKAFQNAIKCFDERYHDKAIEFLESALKYDPDFTDAFILKASVYEEMHQYEQAIVAYRQSILISPDYFPNSYYTLAKIEFRIAQYDSASVHFKKFLTYKDTRPELAQRAKQYLRNCEFASKAIKNPVPFSPVNMGEGINTADEEYFPAITADGKTFLFTRRLKAMDEYNHLVMQEDFYLSQWEKNSWSLAKPVAEINTTGNEGAPSFSADGQYLFFAACKELGGYPGNRQGKGSCDIFISKKVGDQFQPPRNLEEPINSGLWESQPSFSSDGRTLYFIRASKTKDGKSNRDIYFTQISDSNRWSDPLQLSDRINTPGDEQSVFIHTDNRTLYFSSDGHPGMGGLDIFMSKRLTDGTWGEPVNLGYPINTSNDENSLLVNAAGDLAYFASNRKGGKGGSDMYQFELDPSIRPEAITYMKGKVFDASTKKPLVASFELIDLATGIPVVKSTSNSGNGEFLVCLPVGKGYALNVSKDGYLFFSDNFELKNLKNPKEPVLKDVPMHAIKTGERVVLKNIFYDTDAYNLKDESAVELGKLIVFLNRNPKVRIEIGGHTDNVGIKPYNQSLSEKRAKAVSDYLVSKGIAASRLSFKGFGDTVPISPNDHEEGRAMNRRTEFFVVAIN